MKPLVAAVAVLVALAAGASVQAQTWRGLRVAPESRCSPYRASDYSYPQSIEARIVVSLGGVWSPYTGRGFAHRRETDIEHIVARSEAHDSGLCAASTNTRPQFSRDLLNLTLASPSVNRHQKRDHDAAEWLPMLNRCWFADRVVRVRHHGKIARIEVQLEEVGRFFEDGIHQKVSERLKEIGYKYVTLDLQGYRSGSLNEVLQKPLLGIEKG